MFVFGRGIHSPQAESRQGTEPALEQRRPEKSAKEAGRVFPTESKRKLMLFVSSVGKWVQTDTKLQNVSISRLHSPMKERSAKKTGSRNGKAMVTLIALRCQMNKVFCVGPLII